VKRASSHPSHGIIVWDVLRLRDETPLRWGTTLIQPHVLRSCEAAKPKVTTIVIVSLGEVTGRAAGDTKLAFRVGDASASAGAKLMPWAGQSLA
jgi:hypothetical protein